MKSLKIASTMACICATAQIAFAQVDPAPSRSEIAVAVGVAQTNQFDATASPLQFGGHGLDFRSRYARTAGRWAFTAGFDGGLRSLTPDRSLTLGDERITQGEFRLDLQRALGASRTPAFSVGLALSTDVGVTAHHYDDPGQSVSNFVMGAITLGPSVGWRHAIGGGLARVNLSVPLVGIVDHPYTDVRAATSNFDMHVVNASTLRGLSADLSYSPAALRRFGIEYGYRLRLLNYADVQPLRSMSQSLTIGVVRRFGRGGDER